MLNTTINILEIMDNKEVLLDYVSNVLMFEKDNSYEINSVHLRSIRDHFINISKTNNSLISYNLSHDFDWLTVSDAKKAIDNLKTILFLTRKQKSLTLKI